MTKLIAIATLLFSVIFLSPNVVMGETIEWDDLVKRNGLYYKKFTDVPFTGKTSGGGQGSFKNGKREGAWVEYHKNGQLDYKGNYKNSKREGAWISYHKNGQLDYKGNFKNGKREGAWISYHKNGQLDYKGNYKNGKQEGAWVSYYSDGLLGSKGNYKNGEKEGAWVIYKLDGTVWKAFTGTYKNDKKISD